LDSLTEKEDLGGPGFDEKNIKPILYEERVREAVKWMDVAQERALHKRCRIQLAD
jgi:hypothetical protein